MVSIRLCPESNPLVVAESGFYKAEHDLKLV
jgi:hypothetical protein